ncbi:MAG: hypothetical protein U1E17_25240, partial [Geminicoccaceae bacterium]
PAAKLLAEVAAEGCELRLKTGRPNVTGRPSPELLVRLRAHRTELVPLLRGDVCRHCGKPMSWPEPCGVILGDGTAEHHDCRLLAAAERAVRGVTDTTDDGELVEADEP